MRLRAARSTGDEPLFLRASFGAEVIEDDLQYVVDLGLSTRNGRVNIANPICREVVPRAFTSVIQAGISAPEPVWVGSEGRIAPETLLEAFRAFWIEHGEVLLGPPRTTKRPLTSSSSSFSIEWRTAGHRDPRVRGRDRTHGCVGVGKKLKGNDLRHIQDRGWGWTRDHLPRCPVPRSPSRLTKPSTAMLEWPRTLLSVIPARERLGPRVRSSGARCGTPISCGLPVRTAGQDLSSVAGLIDGTRQPARFAGNGLGPRPR